MDEILRIANDSKTKNKIIILDCCHAGAFGTPKSLGGKTANICEGMSILTSSKSNEPSMIVNGHSVFTNLLIHALEGGAADIRGNITAGGIYAYIDQALGSWSQRPVFKTNITRFTPIREVKEQVPLETLRDLTKYFKTETDEFKLDPSFEFTNDPNISHEYVPPFANDVNSKIFKNLQKLVAVGLVVPVGEDHMYFAAMKSKACKLTPLGYHYWRLVNEKRI